LSIAKSCIPVENKDYLPFLRYKTTIFCHLRSQDTRPAKTKKQTQTNKQKNPNKQKSHHTHKPKPKKAYPAKKFPSRGIEELIFEDI